MKLSRIALFSLLSAIPLSANDHDIAEPIANDLMAVGADDLISRTLTNNNNNKNNNNISAAHVDTEESSAISDSSMKEHDDAENDETDSTSVVRQAQHEEMEIDPSPEKVPTSGDSQQNDASDTNDVDEYEDKQSEKGTTLNDGDIVGSSETLKKQEAVLPEDTSKTDGPPTLQADDSTSSSSSKDTSEPVDVIHEKVEVVDEKEDDESSPSETNEEPAESSTNATTDAEADLVKKKHEATTTEDEISKQEQEEEKEEEEEKSKPVEVDYANKSTGAQILDKSKKFQGTSNLLVNDKDKYAMIECDAGEGVKYVIIGLSEEILVKSIKLSSYERYSSLTKRFQVLGSQTYPVMTEWEDLGSFDAKPWYKENKEQTFELAQPGWARYLKFRFLEHYGNEHYCSYTQIKVHGSTTLQGFHEMQLEQNEAVEAAKAVVEEIENAGIVKTEDAIAVADVSVEKGNDETVAPNHEDMTEEKDIQMSDDTAIDIPSNEDKAGLDENDNSIPKSNTAAAKDKKGPSVVHDEPQRPSEENPVASHSNTESSINVEDPAENMDSKVPDQTIQSDILQDSSLDHDAGVDKMQHTDGDKLKAEEHGKFEESSGSVNGGEETVNSEVKASVSGMNSRDAPKTDEITDGDHVLPSPPSVTSAVTSAINAVKKGSLVKDAVQGINKMIHSNTDSKSHRTAADEKPEPRTTEGKENKKIDAVEVTAEDSVHDVVVTAKDHDDVVTDVSSPESKEEFEPDGQGVAVSNASETKLNAINNTHRGTDYANPEELLLAKNMVTILSNRFPNAKCLDYLDFAEFKKRTLETASQRGASTVEKAKGTVQKNEPIFKKLTDEIKGLQASQSVYEQYIKAATSCYQRVVLDLGNDIISKQKEQEHRMKYLEDELMRLKEDGQRQGWSTDVVLANIRSLFEKSVSFIATTYPCFFSWCRYCIVICIQVTERVMSDERVQKIISFVVEYKRDGYNFMFGVLFSWIILTMRRNATNSDANEKKAKRNRKLSKQHRSKLEEDDIISLHNTPSLNTDDEVSY